MIPDPANPQDPPALDPQDAAWVPTWRAAYADRTAALMATFSQLAYIAFSGGPTASDPGVAELRAKLADGAFQLTAVFNKGNVQAFLAVNKDQLAVLAFRGTANFADWGIDLNAIRIPAPGFPNVCIHEGFWNAYALLKDDVLAAVNANVSADLGLYITGHSLGGGLAQIAAAMLERDNLAACYTFGSPRVATQAFDTDVKCPHYRLVNDWDLVPGVPPPTPWGYQRNGDPRLLRGPSPQQVLRRDQGIIGRFVVVLLAMLRWIFTHDFSSVDDHMIWNYRTKLEAIVAARAPPPPPAPSPAPKPKRAPRKLKRAA